MTATTSLREIARLIVDGAMPATNSGATCFVPRYQIDRLEAALSTPPAGELRALAHDMGMFLNRYRAVLPSQAMAESYALHNRLNALAWDAASTPEPATQEVG